MQDETVFKLTLKKDLVIKAGTQFVISPSMQKNVGTGHYIGTFGLGNDSCGDVMFHIDDSNSKTANEIYNEWFDMPDGFQIVHPPREE
jgi:hypothetical protein